MHLLNHLLILPLSSLIISQKEKQMKITMFFPSVPLVQREGDFLVLPLLVELLAGRILSL